MHLCPSFLAMYEIYQPRKFTTHSASASPAEPTKHRNYFKLSLEKGIIGDKKLKTIVQLKSFEVPDEIEKEGRTCYF